MGIQVYRGASTETEGEKGKTRNADVNEVIKEKVDYRERDRDRFMRACVSIYLETWERQSAQAGSQTQQIERNDARDPIASLCYIWATLMNSDARLIYHLLSLQPLT